MNQHLLLLLLPVALVHYWKEACGPYISSPARTRGEA